MIQKTHLCQHRHANSLVFTDTAVSPHYAPDLILEPIHLDIAAYIPVGIKQFHAQVTTTVKANGTSSQTLVLDAIDFEDMVVEDPDGNDLQWQYNGKKITIRWEKPFEQGEERQVAIRYRAIEPADGLLFSSPNEAYPDQAWYMVSDNETERARHWLPCIDHPNVRTTLTFHLKTEPRFTVLANGVLVGEEQTERIKTSHWQLDQRCPSYLICIALGDFTVADGGSFDDGEKQIPLAYFSTREHSEADLMRTFGPTRAMMAWMTKKLKRPFPFAKYYQFATPDILGAMENISLVSWDDNYLQDETLASELGWWVDDVNVHEMAHSYFGDAVVCRDFAHAWLKESWATFMELCWHEDNSSPEEADYKFLIQAQAYLEEADENYKRPIVTRRFKSSWQMFDRHLYPGGACRLSTLRHEMGDDVFWTAVNVYLTRYDGKVVETNHFRHVMEEVSGRSLAQFFEQWFYTAAYPSIKVSFNYDADKKQGTFEVEQTQVDTKEGIPAFVLSTELGWTIDGQSHVQAIQLDNGRHVFNISMAQEPTQVRFDPNRKILHKLDFDPGNTLLRNQLRDATDVYGRIQAALTLAKSGKRGNVQAVLTAYESEPFWGARRQMANALGKTNSETAVSGLVKLIAQEKDPLVMNSVFGAAGNFRDGRIQEALVARLEAGLPYLASLAAYEALGAQRKAAPLDLLLEASQVEGFNGVAQSGALHGLAATRQSKAVDHLLKAVDYGANSNRVRPAAIIALASIGQGQEKGKREEIVEKLIDLLRDPWYRAHRAAATGLQMMEATEAVPALKAYVSRLAHQDQVTTESGVIAALQGSDKSDGSAVKKQVEELQATIRKLENRIEDLEAAK